MLTGIFRTVVAPVALVVLFLVSGCSQTVTHPTPPPTLTSIVVTGPTSVAVGQTIQLTATGTYSDGSVEDMTSKAVWRGGWLGMAPSLHILTVSPGGIVKGEHAGTATVTARCGENQPGGQFSVTVVP